MSVFLYRDINSFLHKLDPRAKLLVMLTFFIYALMFLPNPVLQEWSSCLFSAMPRWDGL